MARVYSSPAAAAQPLLQLEAGQAEFTGSNTYAELEAGALPLATPTGIVPAAASDSFDPATLFVARLSGVVNWKNKHAPVSWIHRFIILLLLAAVPVVSPAAVVYPVLCDPLLSSPSYFSVLVYLRRIGYWRFCQLTQHLYHRRQLLYLSCVGSNLSLSIL